MDNGGCLTCHKYPGLVALEKPNRLKILHINEERYLKSTHGAIDCRECHSQINRVPHTGNTVVMCSSNCHNQYSYMDSYEMGENCTECHSDYDVMVSKMDYYLNTFHKNEQSSVVKLLNESSCRVCHPLYPHSENKLVRALINMHAGFMICEVCHLRNNSEGEFKVCGTCHQRRGNTTYGLGSPENIIFSGEPYGNYSTNPLEKKGLMQSVKKLAAKISKILNPTLTQKDLPEKKMWTKYSVSRISIFSEGEGKKRLLMNTWDTKIALKFKRIEKRLNPVSKKRKIEYFHRDIAKKNISMACEECHSSESSIDYKSLGISESKASMLREINIKGLVTKYDTFFFPKLLEVE